MTATPPEVASVALAVEGLARSFGRHRVLDGVDLTVTSGSFTAVLGPSGGGKTTLLRIIAGFDHPESGTVRLAGQVVADGRRSLAPERRRVGIVPQEGALFPHLTVEGNVGFGLRRRDASTLDRRRRIAEVLELVGLPGSERAHPNELSGGQQQRVALARALAPRPSVVLLDEPFSSLDAALRAQLRTEVLGALRADGATAVMVTHDQLEAMSISDQVAVLLDGRVAQVDDPAQLYARPASLAVGTFVGDAVVLPGERRADRVSCALGRVPVGNGAGVEGPVLVLVRPEQIASVAAAESEVAPGTVVARQYYGHDAVLTVRLSGGEQVQARLHTAGLPGVGEQVSLAVRGPVSAFAVAGGGVHVASRSV